VVDRRRRLAFVLMEYYWWLVAPGQRHHPAAPLGLRIYFNLSWGILSSLYFLMLGYISKDAPRRAMSLRLWMVVCFVLPAASARALLPAPPAEVSKCPLRHHVQSDFHFCPSATTSSPQTAATASAPCAHLTSSAPMRHELATDHAPARLRVLGE